MAKFKLVVEHEYEIPDDQLQNLYGTTDPIEAAKIDQQGASDDPISMLTGVHGTLIVKVEVLGG